MLHELRFVHTAAGGFFSTAAVTVFDGAAFVVVFLAFVLAGSASASSIRFRSRMAAI